MGSSSLVPGFRFHPTDEELVWYYLRRKICAKPFRFDAISDVDVYKVEPWDLPGLSRLKTRDLEWYFFSVLDKKYGNGSRTNRATDRGYWKTTGKDRSVYHRSQPIGMKKTLVYHIGRAPKGERTNWVMHEYGLIDQELEQAGVAQDAFVLCRIFRKSGSGQRMVKTTERHLLTRNGRRMSWQWSQSRILLRDFPVVDDDAYLDADELEQRPALQTIPTTADVVRKDNGKSRSSEMGLQRTKKDHAVRSMATQAGQVNVLDGSSVWNDAVLRGDLNKITVGFCSNVQEKCVVHAAWSSPTGKMCSFIRAYLHWTTFCYHVAS